MTRNQKNYNVSPDLPSIETLPISLYFRLGPDQMTLVLYVTDRKFYKTRVSDKEMTRKKFATAKVGNFF